MRFSVFMVLLLRFGSPLSGKWPMPLPRADLSYFYFCSAPVCACLAEPPPFTYLVVYNMPINYMSEAPSLLYPQFVGNLPI